MLDENVWLQLTSTEKFEEIEKTLNALLEIEEGKHPLSHTLEQGKLPSIRKELEAKFFNILDIENLL